MTGRHPVLAQIAQNTHLSQPLVLQPRRGIVLREAPVVQVSRFFQLGQHRVHVLLSLRPAA